MTRSNLIRIIDPKVGGSFGTEGVYASYLGKAFFAATGRLHLKITVEETLAQHLEEHGTIGPDVGAVIGALAARLFG